MRLIRCLHVCYDRLTTEHHTDHRLVVSIDGRVASVALRAQGHMKR